MFRTFRTPVVVTLIAGLVAASVHAESRTSVPNLNDPRRNLATIASPRGFSDVLLKAYPEYERFRDERYLRLLAADGLRTADPQAVVERMRAAATRGELYKGLYLSRVFTAAKPELPAGWTNRARLAASLGFDAEAAASQRNAEAPGSAAVPAAALPGKLKVRPATLSDWAAALALVADDVAATEGAHAIVAVRDDLSGLTPASDDDVAQEKRGPWATAKPVQVEHVLTNLFVLRQATPMDKKSMKGGLFALGAVALGASTFATTVGATEAAAAFTEMYGEAMSGAFEVPSELKDGSFVSVTFAGNTAKAVENKPRTAGKYEAVGTPLPILWASGGSMNPALQAQWKNGDESKSQAIRLDAKTTKRDWKKQQVPALAYPRVAQVCINARLCSPHVTVFELMLTAEDVAVLAPGLQSAVPDTSKFAAMYAANQPLSVIAAGDSLVGVDPAGVVYVTRLRPTEWLTPAATTKK